MKDTKKMSNYPTWDEYFMSVAKLVATRSTCLRHHIGAIVVKDRRILTTGYNGAPKGTVSCLEEGKCMRDELGIESGTRHEICKAVHAEQNAIIQAAVHGVSIDGGTIYCTHSPCILCAKMIVNAGIMRVISSNTYPDHMAEKLFEEAGIATCTIV